MKINRLLLTIMLLASLGMVSGCGDDDEAATAAGGGGSSSNGDLGDSTPTGRISADGFYMLFDPAIPSVFDEDRNYTQESVVITAFAEDVNDLVEFGGQTVNFKAEWGSWLDERDSCVISNGSCSVTWRSGDPATAPGSCFVAITAWTVGEESFFDANDNGVFDATETFNDLEEPFLNINYVQNWNIPLDLTYTPGISTVELVGELIDITDFNGPGLSLPGDHDSGNGLYDGSLCASGNPQCSGRESMIIHTRSNLLIQEPFTDSDDLDADSDTDENITFCGFNLY